MCIFSGIPSNLTTNYTITGFTGNCNNVFNEFPSTISFDQNRFLNTTARFNFTSYSTENCKDDELLELATIDPKVPFPFNDRTPICSFMLGKNPTTDPPTIVVLNYSNAPNKIILNDKGCINLNEGCDADNKQHNQYPIFVGIRHENDTSSIEANNFLQLYSNNNCLGKPLVKRNKNNSPEINDGDHLLDLTDDPNKKYLLIKSFILNLDSVTGY